MSEASSVVVHLLDKEFRVGCPPEEKENLIRAARFLDDKMREIRASNVLGLERIAVMAALNLAYDLMTAESRTRSDDSSQRELKRLDRKLTKVLNDLERPSAE